MNLRSGSNNICIGHVGAAADAGVIRIGGSPHPHRVPARGSRRGAERHRRRSLRAAGRSEVRDVQSGLPTVERPSFGTEEPNPCAARERVVGIDFAAFPASALGAPGAGSVLRPNLFEDRFALAVVDRVEPTFGGGLAFSFTVPGGGEGSFVVNGEVVVGEVRLPGALFRISPGLAGRHVVSEIDRSLLPPPGPPLEPPAEQGGFVGVRRGVFREGLPLTLRSVPPARRPACPGSRDPLRA